MNQGFEQFWAYKTKLQKEPGGYVPAEEALWLKLGKITLIPD